MLAFKIIAAIFLLFLLGVLLIVFFLGVGHKSKNEKSSTQFLSFFLLLEYHDCPKKFPFLKQVVVGLVW